MKGRLAAWFRDRGSLKYADASPLARAQFMAASDGAARVFLVTKSLISTSPNETSKADEAYPRNPPGDPRDRFAQSKPSKG